MLNARYDLARIMYKMQNGGQEPTNGLHDSKEDDVANECTSVYFYPEATANGHAIAAQNWDMSTHLYDHDLCIYLEIYPDPSEDRPSMLCLTESGQLIRTVMNAAGLAVTANSLLSSEDYVPISYTDTEGVFHKISPKLVLPLTLARRIFLEYRLYSEGLVAINTIPRHVSGNLHVSTSEGFGMALEVSPYRIYKVYGNIDDNCKFIL
jgi:isopenicillin-N N-acyltransferase-like protein